jgi:hypothetical protein
MNTCAVNRNTHRAIRFHFAPQHFTPSFKTGLGCDPYLSQDTSREIVMAIIVYGSSALLIGAVRRH